MLPPGGESMLQVTLWCFIFRMNYVSVKGQVEHNTTHCETPFSGICLPNDVDMLMLVGWHLSVQTQSNSCLYLSLILLIWMFYDWLPHRPWIPEEADCAECPWPSPEFGGYHVESPRLAAQPQVSVNMFSPCGSMMPQVISGLLLSLKRNTHVNMQQNSLLDWCIKQLTLNSCVVAVWRFATCFTSGFHYL